MTLRARKSMGLVTGVTAVAVVMSAVPGHAMTQLPPTSQLSAAQLEQVRKEYLADVCPAARYGNRVLATFKRVWGDRKSVPYGSPMPKSLRVKYRKYAVVLDKRGQRLQAGAWPEDLVVPINQLITGSRSASKYFKSRDTATVSRKWRPSYTDTSGASAQIRSALLFPAEGDIC